MSDGNEMHIGAWRIGTFDSSAGWCSVCERTGGDPVAHFGPFASRDRARRVALFHALWLDGLLTEGQAVAMLEGRAEVVGGQRTADEAPDETVSLVHRLGAAAAAMNAGDVLPMTAGDFEHAKDTIAALLAEVRRARSELTAARVGGEDVADGIRLLAAGREDARRERDAARGEAQAKPSRPEPPPLSRGEPVTPPLLDWLRSHGLEDEARVVEARAAFGLEKYGQPLMTLDGRDPVEDARQELADALQYIQRAAMLGADLTPIAGLLDALCARAIDAQSMRLADADNDEADR